MAKIQIGDVRGAIYQVERPIHLNPDGSAQATLSYKCSVDSGLVVIPAYLTPHPSYPALKCYESELDYEPGGIAKITSIYKGVYATNPMALAQPSFQRTLTEAPVETNPMFAMPRNNPPVTPTMMAAIENRLSNCLPADPAWTPMQTLLFEKKRRGNDTWLRPGGSFRISYCSADIPPDSYWEGVGMIATPPKPAPAAPAGMNYLYMGCSWEKQAGVVRISLEFQLSGPGGWDPDFYNGPAADKDPKNNSRSIQNGAKTTWTKFL